ncbi:unnamed protein product [Lathyrus oleraceus]
MCTVCILPKVIDDFLIILSISGSCFCTTLTAGHAEHSSVRSMLTFVGCLSGMLMAVNGYYLRNCQNLHLSRFLLLLTFMSKDKDPRTQPTPG